MLVVSSLRGMYFAFIDGKPNTFKSIFADLYADHPELPNLDQKSGTFCVSGSVHIVDSVLFNRVYIRWGHYLSSSFYIHLFRQKISTSWLY